MKEPPIVGTVKGNLTFTEIIAARRGYLVKCQCSCGQVVTFHASKLQGYKSRLASCNIEGHRYNNLLRHGHAKKGETDPVFNIWVGMRQRCSNPKIKCWERYGGRGISVCERWESFESFLEDMGPRPSKNHQIERKDNNGNYEPDNCCWATRKQQCRNRRSSRLVEWSGNSRTIAEWSDLLGLSQKAIQQRLSNGWSAERTMTTKPMKNQYATK